MRQRMHLSALTLTSALAFAAPGAHAQDVPVNVEESPNGALNFVPDLDAAPAVRAWVRQSGEDNYTEVRQGGADPGGDAGQLGLTPRTLGADVPPSAPATAYGLLFDNDVNAFVAQRGILGDVVVNQTGTKGPATAVAVDTGTNNTFTIEQSGEGPQTAFVTLSGTNINRPGAGEKARDIKIRDNELPEDATRQQVRADLDDAEGSVRQSGGANFAIVEARGDNSVVGVSQTNTTGQFPNVGLITQHADHSRVVQVQKGAANTAIAEQHGAQNSIAQYQDGVGNFALQIQDGRNNASGVVQIGDGNSFVEVQHGDGLGDGMAVIQSGGTTMMKRTVGAQGSQ